MKAKEAPEKIWVHELSAMKLNVPLKEYHIEYTRTDAFIEKAANWISEHTSLSEKLVIENFKKYMKEESNRVRTTIQLEKCDIINLIRGIDPNYKVMQTALYMGLGKFSGGFSEEFRWESSTNKCWEVGTAEELYNLYLKFKELLQD